MLKRVLIILAGLLALLAAGAMLAAWWYLYTDDVQAPDLPGHMTSDSLQHDGLNRSWQAYIPASLSAPAPVVMILHGSRGSGQRMLEGTRYGFNIAAERHGFIPVYPDGFEQHWNDCRAGAAYTANLRDIDDVGFIRAMVEKLATQHDVDRSRIYVAGMSNGGQMAYRMGFEAPDLVAGIAAIAANLPVDDNLDCERAARPVATLVVNGTADPVNPYAGGVVTVGGDSSRGLVRSAADTARYWAELAGYAGKGAFAVWPERSADDSTSVESTLWSAAGKQPVQLLTVVGGGHTIPHPVFRLPRILGPTSHEFEAAEVIWEFFATGVSRPLGVD